MSRPRKTIARQPVRLDLRLDEERRQSTAALLSVISYARDEARRASSDFVVFCLDIAYAAARSEVAARPLSLDGLRPFIPGFVAPPGETPETEVSELLH